MNFGGIPSSSVSCNNLKRIGIKFFVILVEFSSEAVWS